MIEDDERLMTPADVAARLKVTARRVRMIPAHELPYRQLEARGRRQYAERDVAAYVERRTVRR
jgi:hypothetical protein